MHHRNLLLTFPVLLLVACEHRPSFTPLSEQDRLAIVSENLDYRKEREDFLRNSPDSPFRRDTLIEFHGTNWYPVDVRYRGRSVLHRYAKAETIIVKGTRGEDRKQLRYGYFEFAVPDSGERPTLIRVNVYKFTPFDSLRYARYPNYLSVWFTDMTTGSETYGVGRYVDVGDEFPDRDHLYTIDLNMSYNPYCAYNASYSCAVPSKEDHLPVPIRAGEKMYHD